MRGTPTETPPAAIDSSRSALEFVHRLLTAPNTAQPNLFDLLGELAAGFAAPAAGLAMLPEGVPLHIHPAPAGGAPTEVALPWREQPSLIEQSLRARTAMTIPRSAGGSYLLSVFGTPEHGGSLLWLEDGERAQWSAGEASALLLAGQVLTRRLAGEEALPRWAEQLDRSVRQQRLEAAASLVRRLAHDFGNILTGILGFSELALTQQLSTHSPLHAYLTEVYRSAQNGAQYTNQLRLFARRQATTSRSCNLTAALVEEEKRLRPSLGAEVCLDIDVPPDLPAVALDAEPLRQLLGIVLDNAREAIAGTGVITVSARTVQVSAAETRDLFGDVRPGTHLEITVADTGSGLPPDVRRQLFTDPFFTTKARKKGFGLAIAYGIVSAHRGGLELFPRSEGGVLVRIVLPAVPDDCGRQANPQSAIGKLRAEKILVVDDDPMILQLVTATLTRAGYRVQAVGSAEAALRSYSDAAGDPFGLVLSDVLMPDIDGIDLARRLLVLDAKVRVLFMSGQVPADFATQQFAPGQFDLLPKPFRPDGLVHAVRTALDRLPVAADDKVTR